MTANGEAHRAVRVSTVPYEYLPCMALKSLGDKAMTANREANRPIKVSTVPYEYLPCMVIKLLAHYSRGDGVLMTVDAKKVNYILHTVDQRLTATHILVSLVRDFLKQFTVSAGKKRLVHLRRDAIPEYLAMVGKSVDCRAWDRRLANLDPLFGLK